MKPGPKKSIRKKEVAQLRKNAQISLKDPALTEPGPA